MVQLSGHQKKLVQDILLVALMVMLVTSLSLSGWMDYLNGRLYDALVTSSHPVPEHHDNIVFACIDQTSLTYYDEQGAVSWPWPRLFYAQLLRYLASCGAKAVVFDIIFSETDVDRSNEEGETSDNEFANAMAETGIAYLAVSDQSNTSGPADDIQYNWHLSDPGSFERCTSLPSYDRSLLPYHTFLTVQPGLGFVNMVPERDGIHRRYPLVSKVGGQLVPSLALSVARGIMTPGEYRERVLDRLTSPRLMDNEGKIFINWYGIGGVDSKELKDNVFTYYSFHAIIASSIQAESGYEPVIPKEAFNGKIVFVGSNAPGLLDLKATPFTSQNLYPGMEIHATALANLLYGDYMYRISYWTVILLMFLTTAGMFFINQQFASLRVFIAGYVIIMICLAAASYLLIRGEIFFPASEVMLSVTLVFVGLVISGYFSESKDKRLLRRQFERYVNDSVLEEILANPETIDLGGRTVYATVMATDIADFTTISEKLPPHEVVSRLNDYLSEVSEILIDNAAFINKYIGDAILAVYGAFGEADHETNACHAALEAALIIQRKIGEAERAGQDPLVTRFGITTGEITMGNIGSARKIEYTVIGDTVNSAFRLEGLNKFYRTGILVSEDTVFATGDTFEFRLIDILRYKGKLTPVRIYELLGICGEVPDEVLYRRDEFEQALSLYRDRNFVAAGNRFTSLAENGDEPSSVFRNRCHAFISEPPPPDWNGVWIMQRK